MHVVVAALFLIAAWLWGDWRSWKKYHSTILYVLACDLLYLFFTANYSLWEYLADWWTPSYSMTQLLYDFIVLPAIIMIYMSNYPVHRHFTYKCGYVVCWVALLLILEWLLLWADRFQYGHGWNFWWSVGFDFVMFPMIRLHHRKPLLTYALSAIIIWYLLWKFQVPIRLPVEERHG